MCDKINVEKYKEYNPLAGSSYIKLVKGLDHPRKRLINIQNIDDKECFKWSIVRFVNTENHYPARITKAEKEFTTKLSGRHRIKRHKISSKT